MARTKVDFETRNFGPGFSDTHENLKTIEEADKLCRFHNQCTYEESQTNSRGYSHIIEYRDDEQYNDLYFI